MQCFVYKSQKKLDHFLYLNQMVEEDSSLDAVPEALLEMLGHLSFVVEFQLDESRKLAVADSSQVLTDIENKGYFLQMPKDDLYSEEERFFS